MFYHSLLVYLPFTLFLAGVAVFGMNGIHAGVALLYWVARKPKVSSQSEEEKRALDWISMVYGSAVSSRFLRRCLLFSGLAGCFSAGFLLADMGWNGVRGTPSPAGVAFSLWYLCSILLVFPPIAVLQFSWSTPILQRKNRATAQIFGSTDSLRRSAEALRKRYPDAERGPTLWAFPMGRLGFISRFEGAPFWFFLSTMVALFFTAKSVFAFLAGVSFLAALLMLPLNFFGFLCAFGAWGLPAEPALLAYPVSVFLSESRVL